MNIVELLRQWFNDSTAINLSTIYAEYGLSYHHYLTEIIRYWNKLQFIVKKTLRSLSKDRNAENLNLETCIYITYRFFWEEAQFQDIVNEINTNLNVPEKKILFKFYERLSTFKWDIALQNKTLVDKLSIRCAIPSFTINTLLPVLDYSSIKQNIVAMDTRSRKGIIYIRINNLVVPTKSLSELQIEIAKYFSGIGVKTEPEDTFPNMLQASVMDKRRIVKSEYYQNNSITFQDKASFSSILLLDPQPNDLICDLCAAPGIKTSLIAQQSEGKATVIAGDFHHERLQKMINFLTKCRVTNVNISQWDGIHPPLVAESFDRILLDAPCTGSGTFTSNPELKWRQTKNFLDRNVILQEKLLKSASALLKPGGTLVYSTCSLYPEEGEYQIQKIMNEQLEFKKGPSWLPPSYIINNSSIRGTGRFFPAKHNTIGFFVAKIVKRKGNNFENNEVQNI